jgi:tripartite-type tricarboxylate transporter receptor subunit TctC
MKKLFTLSLSVLLVLGMFSFRSGVQAAEKYPAKPITYICAIEAGADADILVRPLLQKASNILGKPIVVVNKPGGSMSLGYRELQGSKPDGYTIGLATGTMVSNKLLGLMPFDHQEYTILGTYAIYVPIIVSATKSPKSFKTIQEAISFAKSHPEEVSVATSHVGGVWWISTMYFQESIGAKLNVIPQAGGGALSITQVAGGHTDLGILATGAAKSQIEAGNVKVLAVFGPKRFSGKYESVPTLKESGYNISFESPQMILGPPKMPPEIVKQLVKTFGDVANSPEYVRFVEEQNAIPYYLSPEDTLKRLDEQREIYRQILQKAGLIKEKR